MGMVAAGKISAADRSLEQYVADLGETGLPVEENHVSGRVAGAVPDLKLSFADLHGIAFAEPTVGYKGACANEAPGLDGGGNLFDPEQVVRMRSLNRCAAGFAQGLCAPGVVGVAVCYPNFLNGEAFVGDRIEQPFNVAAWVDDGGFQGFSTPNDGAVLLEGRHRHDQD